MLNVILYGKLKGLTMFSMLNIELTTKCNKSCSFCFSAKQRGKNGYQSGDMDYNLLIDIIRQFKGNVIQFHRDGEPLLYKRFKDLSAYLWAYQEIFPVTNIVTNGKLLYEKRHELVNSFTTITVSVFEDDKKQFETITNFVGYNYRRYRLNYPIVYIKFLEDYYNPDFEKMGLKVLRRAIHNEIQKDIDESVSEIGICLDFLNKPSITWQGDLLICNRYDPNRIGKIGDVNKQSLKEIWDSDIRHEWLEYHKKGQRDKIPLCKDCNYWGIPKGGDNNASKK